MNKPLSVDLFVEDRAHEEFAKALLQRLAHEKGKNIVLHVRSAIGGHGRALDELDTHQLAIIKGIGGIRTPDVLVVVIDSNCKKQAPAYRAVKERIRKEFQNISAIGCPYPHVERWYMSDREAFSRVVGSGVVLGKRKCVRDYYKDKMKQAIRKGGHIAPLGGIEFAEEILAAMDLYKAGREETSLKHFLDQIKAFM